MNVYVITGGHIDLAADMSTREVLEDQLSPNAVYATVEGAMRTFEEEIAEYAVEQANSLEGIQLPLTVEWKARSYPIHPPCSTRTGRVWETTNPFTEETLQVHEMILGA